MTGLNLETFLHLLRADLGAWAGLGLVVLVFGLMAWTSWGSRRALRKCLVLSILAHAGLAFYGGSSPSLLRALSPDAKTPAAERDRLRRIEVTKLPETEPPGGDPSDPRPGAGGSRARNVAPWDRPPVGLALADAKLSAPAPRGPPPPCRCAPATAPPWRRAPPRRRPRPPRRPRRRRRRSRRRRPRPPRRRRASPPPATTSTRARPRRPPP